jgi:hypothetical protein
VPKGEQNANDEPIPKKESVQIDGHGTGRPKLAAAGRQEGLISAFFRTQSERRIRIRIVEPATAATTRSTFTAPRVAVTCATMAIRSRKEN